MDSAYNSYNKRNDNVRLYNRDRCRLNVEDNEDHSDSDIDTEGGNVWRNRVYDCDFMPDFLQRLGPQIHLLESTITEIF